MAGASGNQPGRTGSFGMERKPSDRKDHPGADTARRGERPQTEVIAMTVSEGKAAPDFKLDASTGNKVALKDLLGKWVVVYFYPKDDTPGCTREACAFRDNHKRLESLGAVVLGVSPDDLKAHDKFISKYDLPFTLLADPDHAVADKYGVWQEKNMYGKKVMGIVRSTFLINPEGKIHKAWRKVKVEAHVDEVMDELKAAQAG